MKKICSVILSFLLTAAVCSVSALEFPDVPAGSSYYSAVDALSNRGIINGYDDGTFRPEGTITRAEAAAIIARANGVSKEALALYQASTYTDVPDNHWAMPYIMYVSDLGIVNGFGDGTFGPEQRVTYHQMLKMVCVLSGLKSAAENSGGWPYGYVRAAYGNGIIDDMQYASFIAPANEQQGEQPAIRGDVAGFISKALEYQAGLAQKEENMLSIKDASDTLYLGMREEDLTSAFGEPEEILPSVFGYNWYVYGTKTYKNFFVAGVGEGKVQSLAAAGDGFVYGGYSAGDLLSPDDDSVNVQYIYSDKNDGGKIHGVFLREYAENKNTSKDAAAGESKMNFHFTNAFRVHHGKSILTWCDMAAAAARLHSEDMAENNYFAHDSQDGTKFIERMKRQGIHRYSSAGENIAAGSVSGIQAHDLWVNSAGHRENMLGDFSLLGVGGVYDMSSDYHAYFTQDFYSK